MLALSTLSFNTYANTWTVSATGTISAGYDESGVFGVAGQDLTGLTFKQSITVSVDPALWTNQGEYSVSGWGPDFKQTTTVNGVTNSYEGYWTYGEQYISNGVSSGRHGYFDWASSYVSGTVQDDMSQYALTGFLSVRSAITPFVATSDFSQTLTVIPDSTYIASAQFILFGVGRDTRFNAYSIDSITINAVPEPETYALLLAGLGLVGVVARRRRVAA